MLLSLLLSLTSTTSAPILGSLGRPANAWFLRQVTLASPRMGERLHAGSGSRPYTVSTLLDARGRPVQSGDWLVKDEEYWLRITTFEESKKGKTGLSDFILNKVFTERNKELSRTIELYKMNFRLEDWTLDPAQHPWAGQTTFADIAQDTHLPTHSRQVRLKFATPTAFRSGDADIPLPIPAQVFHSYWNKWNTFTPEPFRIQDEWKDFVADCIMVNELTGVNTDRWEFAEGTRGIATGFTGIVGFTLLPKHQCGKWADQWEGADRVLQTLSQFAFYCGTGHHATVGMGQTRMI